MGALALPTPWIPEDDLMLKNAIENGASLESLAKGAVGFSRRFTFKELQDRWFALLYDPIISTRAAEQMVELERSAAHLASKSNRADSSKGAKIAHGKRKAESVRRCYYAMKKKVCNEHHNQGDMAFLIGTGDNCFMDGVEAPIADNMVGDPMVGHFGIGEYEHVDFDELRNEFPQIIRDGAPSCGASEFPIKKHNTCEDHVEHNTMLPLNASSKELPSHSMYEGGSIQVNTDCNRKDIMCSGFEGNTAFNSSIPECETQFHLLYTSPPPALPDWKTIDGMPVPEIPDDINIKGKNIHTGDPFGNNDAGGTSEYGVMHTDPDLTNQMLGDDLENLGGCTEGMFSEFPYRFTSEEEMHIFDGGRSVNDEIKYIDALELELLLSESSDAVNEDDRLPNVFETNDTSATDLYIDIPNNTGPFEKNDADAHMGESNFQNSADTQMPMSTAFVNSEFPEYRDGVICCTLNTEDPEIPCNDHIVFPSKPRAANRRTQSEANNSSLHGKDNTGAQPSGKGLSTMKKEQKRFGESRQSSLTRGPDVGINRSIHEPGVKFDTSRPETFNGPRSSSGGPGAPCQSSQGVKKEPLELPLARQPGCSVAEKSSHISDVGHIQTAVGGISQDGQTSLALKNQESLALGSADGMGVEPGIEPLLSDPEEQFSESDTDIPYFSDVEAMILDMDLGPEDQDFFCSREVAKYQHEDVRRAIIRLEQNAHSYMQRAMESHGALAALCGRHSRHYIKKPEVLLGRATDDVMVDIDLGREGRANKISRRQAIIKMDKDGTFNLKNTGKCSIYVNSNEVFPRQSLGLQSNCLIEIRGMPFIFDTQKKLVKKYLDNAARKLEDKKVNI